MLCLLQEHMTCQNSSLELRENAGSPNQMSIHNEKIYMMQGIWDTLLMLDTHS